jgi:hypothetical protein
MMVKKLNLLITLTLLYNSNLFGQVYNKQNTYLDALELANIRNSIPKNNKDTIYTITSFADAFRRIVRKYGNDSELLKNPFLKDYLLGIYPPDTSVKFAEKVIGGDGQIGKKIYKPIGYFSENFASTSLTSANWQASAINGMTNFMVGRFKQEMLQIALDQIFKQIKTKEDSVLVKSIFPKTFKQIGALYGSGSSSYYTADLLLLRQTVQIDIEQLPKNIITNPETIFPKLKNEPKIKDLLALGNYIVEYSQQGQSLDRLFSILANETYSSDSTVYKIINVADLISQALLNKEGSKDIWVNPANILPTTAISLKNLEIRYFYGILYQQLIQIPEFKKYLESQDSNEISLIAAKLQDLVRFVNKLNSVYNYIKSKEFNLKSPEEIVTYIKDINQTISIFTTTLKKIPEINNHYMLNDNLLDISARYITIAAALIKQDYQKVIPSLVIEFGDYMIDMNGKSSRTISFLSQLATIESADDMEALLNSYALPIGSSSIKRHSSFNISVNSYVGLTGGWERAYGTEKNQTKGNIGLSAPIGISATFRNGYLTPFVSLIDLGSVVNQRLNNDTTSYSNLKFEHFFTPGLGLFVNFPKLPISAGVHFNYIPNLRTIKYESGNATITESNRSVTRINFSILVDIPFFTLFNKEK